MHQLISNTEQICADNLIYTSYTYPSVTISPDPPALGFHIYRFASQETEPGGDSCQWRGLQHKSVAEAEGVSGVSELVPDRGSSVVAKVLVSSEENAPLWVHAHWAS